MWIKKGEPMRRLFNNNTAYITIALIVLNILDYLFLELIGSTRSTAFMIEYGATYTPLILEQGEYYRLFTSIFMHFGIRHLANNMLILFVIGERLERVLGRVKYLLLYLFCGIGANVISMIMGIMNQETTVGAGASGAIFGVVGGLFVVIAKNRGRLLDLSLQRMGVMIFFSLYLGFSSSGVDNAAHVGGLLLGMVVAFLIYWRPKGRGY
jgi:rhomboid protease GluP